MTEETIKREEGRVLEGSRRQERGRYPYRIPIRMTNAERTKIGQSACAANQSVSRYLVELATKERMVRPQEHARLRYLQALFQAAANKLQALLSSLRLMHGEEISYEMKMHLEEIACLLEALSSEITRRLV